MSNGHSMSAGLGTEREAFIWRWFGPDTRWQK